MQINTKLTDTNGEYLFSGVVEGLYYVQLSGIGIPANYVSSTGEGIYDEDGAGPYEPSLGTDDNQDDIDDGSQMGLAIMSDTIRLIPGDEPGGDANYTVDFGLYEPQEFPTVSLGNLVFADLDNDGVFNNADTGLVNVEVVLLSVGLDGEKGTGDDVAIDTQYTDANGEYLFSDQPEGLYYVQLSGTGIPVNYVSSTGNGKYDMTGVGPYEPALGTDQDIDQEDDGTQMGMQIMSDTIRLTDGGEPGFDVNLTVDFGLYEPQDDAILSVGNLVFHDLDNDGLFNNNDTGLVNVEVKLMELGVDGLKNTADDQEVTSTTTDNNGNYQFNSLEEGLYYVLLTGVGVPVDFESSTGEGPYDLDQNGPYEPFTGTDNDVDGEDDGTQVSDTIMSDTFRLVLDNEPSGNSNPTVDFGLFQPQTPPVMALGDQVFVDFENDGLFNNSDVGIPAVKVELFDPGTDGEVGTNDDI